MPAVTGGFADRCGPTTTTPSACCASGAGTVTRPRSLLQPALTMGSARANLKNEPAHVLPYKGTSSIDRGEIKVYGALKCATTSRLIS